MIFVDLNPTSYQKAITNRRIKPGFEDTSYFIKLPLRIHFLHFEKRNAYVMCGKIEHEAT